MLREIAQHLWWQPTDPHDPDSFDVYVQAGSAVYRSSRADAAWRQILADPDPTRFIFSRPLGKIIIRCLTGPDQCKYLLFPDSTAIRVFDPPNLPGVVTICGEAAGLVYPPEYERLFCTGIIMHDTPVLVA